MQKKNIFLEIVATPNPMYVCEYMNDIINAVRLKLRHSITLIANCFKTNKNFNISKNKCNTFNITSNNIHS